MQLLNDPRDQGAVATADDTHEYLVQGVTPDHEEDGAEPVQVDVQDSPITPGETLISTAESDDDAAAFRPLPLQTPTRRTINKALQLTLLRKYVQCAKELGSIPDRTTTEQLLDQAYDEYYFHGGDVNEPRMGYTTFIKLVQNRRGEVTRLHRHGRHHTTHHKKHAKAIQEIHTLVMELERVRRLARHHHRAFHGLDDDHDETVETNPSGSSSGPLDRSLPILINGEEHVLIPKQKLERILQSAHETQQAQAKLFAHVLTLERQLTMMTHKSHYPLGH